jgi:hypothetical protein
MTQSREPAARIMIVDVGSEPSVIPNLRAARRGAMYCMEPTQMLPAPIASAKARANEDPSPMKATLQADVQADVNGGPAALRAVLLSGRRLEAQVLVRRAESG